MNTLAPWRTILVLVLGVAAPYLWVESLLLWSMNVYTPMLKWLWTAFGVRGEWMPAASGVAHSVIVAAAFALALRFIARREWPAASAVFCLAFLVAFVVPGLFESDRSLSDDLVLIAFSLTGALALLACVVALFALLSRFPRSHGA